MNTLKAEKRDMSIKAKKLRREGFVTGNLFGRELEDSIPLKFDKAEIEKLLKVENKGGQVMLEIAGETYDALIKEVDYNPLKGYVDEIDFQALVSNEKVHSVAEIHLVNLEKLSFRSVYISATLLMLFSEMICRICSFATAIKNTPFR